MKLRILIQVSLGILLAGLLVWVFRQVPLTEIATVLGRLRIDQLLILGSVNLLLLVLFSARWRLILQALGHPVPYLNLTAYRLAGFGISYFTPGPQIGGEPLQVHLLKVRHAIPVSTAIAAVTLDKLIEMISNFTFLGIGSTLILASGALPGISAWQTVPIAVGLLSLPLGYLFLLWTGRRPVTELLHWLHKRSSRLDRVVRWSETIMAAEERIFELNRIRPNLILTGIGLSAVTWVLMLWEYRLAMSFLGHSVPILHSLIAFIAARLAFLLPSPGGLGTLEASQVLAMNALGLPAALGLSLSLLIRGRDVLFAGAGLLLSISLSRGALPTRSSINPETTINALQSVQEPILVEVSE